jgi:putative glutamine amidotransferase
VSVSASAGRTEATRSWIGIVAYHLPPGRVSRWLVGGYGVPENYVDAIRRAGGRPVLFPPGGDAAADELLERVDGLVLVGGGDVEPSRYGGSADATTYGVEPDRDALEIQLLRAADAHGAATLAICRGMQVMNVAFGGSLIAHLPDRPGMVEHGTPSGEDHRTHPVKTAPDSLLAAATGGDILECSTHHHQGVEELGERLVATAWSDDGLVEAIERPGGWMLGVQWHPEDTADRDPAQQRLFDSLVERARRKSG